MKAVVMAGGEGTRLRPLTSNQPKPMVPVAGKPCMEHIIDLLRKHGMTDIVVTVAYLPQVIRGYFDDGGELGIELHYSVEETPLGTAGSVKNAAELLDETFLVISGDALCDFDLRALVEAHKRLGAVATLALYSVENPLEFGVVITDSEGRVERFLEKPSWGQVFSDTINTGVYVLEPEVLAAVPDGTAYDFSKQLFPDLLRRGKPVYGHLVEGYWQDIGNLDQYRKANFDALDGRIDLEVTGIRLRDNVVLGDGVQLPDLNQIEGPAVIGNYCQIEAGARIGPYSVLGQNVVVKEGASTERSVIDSGCYIGRSARIDGTILGKGVDVRAHALLNEGVAVGDDCSIGAEAVLDPHVKVYPFKTIEAGAAIHTNLIWESRGITTIFGRDGATGLVNVDITAEVAARIGAAYGTTLAKGASVVASRDAHPASRMIKRAIISGLVSTGVNVSDLRVSLPAVNRHDMRVDERTGGLHVRVDTGDPDLIQVVFFEAPGILASDATIKGIERSFSRQEFRRTSPGEIGTLTYPTRATSSYVAGAARRARSRCDRRPRAAPRPELQLLGRLAGHAVARGRPRCRDGRPERLRRFGREHARPRHLGRARRDRPARPGGRRRSGRCDRQRGRAGVADRRERSRHPARDDAPHARARALGVGPARSAPRPGHRDAHGRGDRPRKRHRRAAHEGVAGRPARDCGRIGRRRLRRCVGRRVRLPRLPARVRRGDVDREDPRARVAGRKDAVRSGARPAASARSSTSRPTARGRRKGTAMRQVIEAVKGLEVDDTDGIKVFEGSGWAQIIPDPDEPVFHIYAEGATREDSQALEAKYRAMLDGFVAAAV